jgi:hypothetical protein
MGVITIQEKFNGWFADQLAADGLDPVQGPECAEALRWAQRGWDGCLNEILLESTRTQMESKVRELHNLAKMFPEEFKSAVERVEKE